MTGAYQNCLLCPMFSVASTTKERSEPPLYVSTAHSLKIHVEVMDSLQEQMLRDLEEIGRTRMPFGKYGPSHYPPLGLPIYELPSEYLGWFLNKGGFPKGRLGVLLAMVYQMKVDGCDEIFNVLRKSPGDRNP